MSKTIVVLEGFPLDRHAAAAQAMFSEPNGHAFDVDAGVVAGADAGVIDGGAGDAGHEDAGGDGGAP